VASYKLKGDAPDNAIETLSKQLVVPLLEKMLADGTILEYEVDTIAVHTEAPGNFWITWGRRQSGRHRQSRNSDIAEVSTRQMRVREQAQSASTMLLKDSRSLEKLRPFLFKPLQAPAVHDLGLSVSKELQDPERIRCPPVILISIKYDGGIAGGSDPAH
jgi:hypothetical protein